MAQRRSLVEGLETTPAVDRAVEESFVYQDKPPPTTSKPSQAVTPAGGPERTRLTTRIRADLAGALKRATLERKLANVTPNAVQEILEEALEPWLKTNGYLN